MLEHYSNLYLEYITVFTRRLASHRVSGTKLSLQPSDPSPETGACGKTSPNKNDHSGKNHSRTVAMLCNQRSRNRVPCQSRDTAYSQRHPNVCADFTGVRRDVCDCGREHCDDCAREKS